MKLGPRMQQLLVGADASARRTLGTLEARRRGRRAAEVALGRARTAFPDDHEVANAMVTSAARRLGVSVEALPGQMLRLRHGDRVVLSYSTDFSFDSSNADRAVRNKFLTSTLLAEQGIPVPRSRAFVLSEYEAAVRYFRSLPKPVVVKPNQGTGGGTGVFLGLRDEGQLRHAFAVGLAHSEDVLIEEQVSGESYRATVLGGEVLSVVRRRRPNIVGDGQHSIGQLVALHNVAFQRDDGSVSQLRPIPAGRAMRAVLRRGGLRLSSVPPAGERVFVGDTANAHGGAELEEVTAITHRDYLELAIAASAAADITLCGVDLLTVDIERPLAETSAVVNEVNTTPGFDIVFPPYGPRRHDRAAEAVLRRIFDLPLRETEQLQAISIDLAQNRRRA